jgi:hypothetical protein
MGDEMPTYTNYDFNNYSGDAYAVNEKKTGFGRIFEKVRRMVQEIIANLKKN